MPRFPHPFKHWSGNTLRVILLHDHESPIPDDDHHLIRELRSRGLTIYAPSGGQSWWLDRICSTFHETKTPEHAIVEFARELDPPIALVGSEAALRIGFRHPQLFPVVANWNSCFDFQDLLGRGTSLDSMFERKEQARQHTAILQVRQNDYPPHIWFGCPIASEYYRGHDRLHEKLAAVGIPHVYTITDAFPLHEMTTFVAERLARQSRRLL